MFAPKIETLSGEDELTKSNAVDSKSTETRLSEAVSNTCTLSTRVRGTSPNSSSFRGTFPRRTPRSQLPFCVRRVVVGSCMGRLYRKRDFPIGHNRHARVVRHVADVNFGHR